MTKNVSLGSPVAWLRIAALLCFAVPAFGQGIVRGPYLQNGTTNSMVLRWRTDVMTPSLVRVGVEQNQLVSEFGDTTLKTDHTITVSGLAPDTRYFYSIVVGGTPLAGGAGYSFVTSPAIARPTRIWAIGDAGTASFGSAAPLAVRNAYREFAGSRRTDVWLMLGDNAYYSGTDEEYQAAVFDVFPEMLRTTPVWSTLGNHETYAPDAGGNLAYTSIFSLPQDGRAGGEPSGTERYYSFNYGDIHFVCLDSELSEKAPAGPMLTWLEADLGANDKAWTIAFWHSPPYTKGSHDSDFESNLVLMRQNALPILESHGVDLVLCGHSHSYERSYFLNGHYGGSSTLASGMVLDAGSGRIDQTGAYRKSSGESQAGAVYVVAGSSGQTTGGLLNHPAMFLSLNQLGSLVIDVDGNRMDVKFLRETGLVADQFSIEKGEFPAQILTGPADLVAYAGESTALSVTAAGTPPLKYQWSFDNQPIAGATGAVLRLDSLTVASAGDYRVAVSNHIGGQLSLPARLSVLDRPTNCIVGGMAGWWPLNETALDWIGGEAAELIGNPSYVPAKVGQGLEFDGGDDSVLIKASAMTDVGIGAGFTVDMWIRPSSVGSPMALAEWTDTSSRLGVHFFVTSYGAGDLSANLIDRGGTSHAFASPAGTVVPHEFQHVALSYDRTSGMAKLYRNGAEVAEANLGVFEPETRPNLSLGRRLLGGSSYRFQGVMDEVGLYSRALSAEDVQSIFRLGSVGRCPSPDSPRIIRQPQSLTAVIGSTVSLNVEVIGQEPLVFQWYLGGNPVEAETSQSLNLANVGVASAGAYRVVVGNSFGSVTSAIAVVTVSGPSTNCAPDGAVGWWPFNSVASDAIGGSGAILSGAPAYAPGVVDFGLRFDGINDSARIPASPALDVGTGRGLTVELWLSPDQVGSSMTLVEWSDTSALLGAHMGTTKNVSGDIYANLISRSGQSHTITSPGHQLVAGQFQHIAVTYDRGTGIGLMYRNGVKIAEAILGAFDVETRPDLFVGQRVLGGTPYRFQGVMDELSVYSRALSREELLAIYQAGAAGKCYLALPSIVQQPAAVTTELGQPVEFSVTALGTPPLTYQWYFEEGVLSEATNRTLALPSAEFANAGSYRVVVANPYGAVTSLVASLTVNYPAARVQVANVNALALGPVRVPLQLVANGNENALTFSLNYDASRLSFVSAELGAGASGGTLVVNGANAAAGQLGLSFQLPPEQTFASGTQTVAMVTFTAGGVGSVQPVAVGFGDTPVVRRLSNVSAAALPVIYLPGTVLISPTTVTAGFAETVTGGFASVPISLAAIGVENAVSFTLVFNPSVLAFSGVRAGADLPPDAPILINSSLAASGQVGVSVALGAGATFPHGLHEILRAEFNVATVLIPLATPIRFGDSPTVRQVANQNAEPLPAVYGAGSVSIVSVALEADIAPRPGGDQQLTVIDWVQAGRFAAALDPVPLVEFQRADCAPRESRGNGFISVADWVQAGRYSAGLDPVTGIGGPIGPAEAGGLGGNGGNGGSPECIVRIVSTNVLPGATVNVPVQVSAIGTENALGFSLVYDATKLRFVGVSKLGSIGAATLNVNTNLAGSGRIGLAFALPTGTSLTSGIHEVLLMTLAAAPAISGTTTVSFGDSPVVREVVTASARTLASSFTSGDIVLGPPPEVGPAVSIARSSENVVIFWSATEAGYVLQASEALRGQPWSNVTVAPIEIGGQKIVTLPRTGSQKYFRLRKP